MKKKVINAFIVVLAVILAGLVALLLWLEMGRKTPEAGETTDTAGATQGVFDPLETKAPAFTFATAGEDEALPEVTFSGVDPMDPNGATEGPEVDPTLGMNETVDPTAPDENELPIVPG